MRNMTMKQYLKRAVKEIPVPQNEQIVGFVLRAVSGATLMNLGGRFGIYNKHQVSGGEMSDIHDDADSAWLDAAIRLGYAALSQPVPQGEQSQLEWTQKLREKAEKATCGPWERGGMMEGYLVMSTHADEPVADCEHREDQAYIAAASPDRILKLLSLLDSQRSKLITVLQREAASQARHDVKLDKLETELLDTKRALEMACEEAGWNIETVLDQARNERKGQQI